MDDMQGTQGEAYVQELVAVMLAEELRARLARARERNSRLHVLLRRALDELPDGNHVGRLRQDILNEITAVPTMPNDWMPRNER